MKPHDDEHHDHEPQPQPQPSGPKPLLPYASVTIYFDGLIYTAYDEKRKLYQGAMLTQAEGHHLVIEVRLKGAPELLWPLNGADWDPDHAKVKAAAPFWLYVDSGAGIDENEFSASLHTGEDVQSFDRVFNFEQKHHRPLPPKPETFARFNFPQGTSYSAENTNAALKTLNADATVTATENINVSTLTALDIDLVSNGGGKKFIVLANEEGKEFFRFLLEPEKPYEIKILNQPIDLHGGHEHLNPQQHFLQFYELFDLKEGEKKFLVAPPLPPTAQSPPCVSTSGDTKAGFGG